MTSAPPALPFTTAEALTRGVSEKRLRGRGYVSLFRGVHVHAGESVTYLTWAMAALLTAPKDAVLSHLTALRAMGLRVGEDERIHLSTRTTATTRHERIVLHRRTAPIAVRDIGGLPVTSGPRTFVDCALRLRFVDLVIAGDWLIRHQHTTLDELVAYVHDRHLDGVCRARRAVRWLVSRSESPMETTVRLMLVFARLPQPAANMDIVDAKGRFVARGDLVYAQWGVVVEYDGRWHERSAEQRRHDRDRRERLEALGWRVIVIVDTDLAHPARIPWRVHEAFVARGYEGPAPVTSVMWHRWFAPRAEDPFEM